MRKIVILFVLLAFPVLSAYASDNVSAGKLKRLESQVQPLGAVIKSVSIDNNTVTINYSGQIKYNVLKGRKLNCPGVYVLDIINPSRVFSTRTQIITPTHRGIISKVVTAWHSTPQDKLLYNAPFLRVSVHINKCKSRIIKENGELKIVFGSKNSTADSQLQKERTVLKKLRAEYLRRDNLTASFTPQTLNAGKHCPVGHGYSRPVSLNHTKNKKKAKKTSGSQSNHKYTFTAPPGRAAHFRLPAYKMYSAKYKIPPIPKYEPRAQHKASTTLKVLPDVFVKPGIITKVTVSNTDVNRIVSPEPIKDVVFSKEKGLMVHFIGKNAFIKFVIKKNPDGTYTYIQEPSEIYVVTQNAVYTIILYPKNTAGRTIRLSGGSLNKIKANERMFAQLPYEKKIVKIIKAVYKNNIPYSWDVTHPQNPTPIIVRGSLTATLITTVNVVGTGFYLKEYKITSPVSMRITETDFLSTKLAKNPRAIALTGFEVSKGNPVYLFIVARGGGSEQ